MDKKHIKKRFAYSLVYRSFMAVGKCLKTQGIPKKNQS